jgi:hypothetical protein
MGEQMTADLVISALNMALHTRRPDSVIHHSDQGSQYTSIAFGSRCREMGVRPSMGTVGDAYDNAMAESFFATLECELINRRSWKSKADARTALFIWIEGWYNPRRRHSALDYLSPINFERKYVDHENRAQQQGCPPRRSVRRKRRPPPWTTLHLRNHRLENQAITCPWDGVKTNPRPEADMTRLPVGLIVKPRSQRRYFICALSCRSRSDNSGYASDSSCPPTPMLSYECSLT